MAEQSVAANYPGPEFLAETEALLRTTAFYDEERAELVDGGNFGELDIAELGVRTALYTYSLRLIAEERWRDRQQANPDDPEGWNEEWRKTNLTHKHLASLALKHESEADTMRRQLALVNNAEQFLSEYQADREGDFQLYSDQEELLQQIAAFLTAEQPAQITKDQVDKFGIARTRFQKGATVIAPTGSGKSVVMGYTADMCGIGETPEDSQSPLRMLIVEPSQDLVEQFTGKTGDDSFRRAARGKSVGAYYQHEKEHLADVVVATEAQFINGCRNGLFFGEEFDILAIDEVHRVTGPRFSRILNEHWDRPAIGFTATPDYHPQKDARQVLPYEIRVRDKAVSEDKSELLAYIKRGRLNGAQLHTFMIDPKDYADQFPEHDLSSPKIYNKLGRRLLDNKVVDFISAQVQEGRRGIVFCEPGDYARHARKLAERLSDPGKNTAGRSIRAKAIGRFNRTQTNWKTIDEYHRGEIDVLLTVEKGREGLNGEFDFVVVNTKTKSFLKLRQIVGRGPRLSKKFPITRYAEFVLPNFDHSIWQVFGLEQIQQGQIVHAGDSDASNRATGIAKPLPAPLEELSGRIDGKLIDEIFIAQSANKEIAVPEDYVSISAIASRFDLPESYAAQRLRRLGYANVSRWEEANSQRSLVRYFEPNAVTHFDENPVAPMATQEMLPIAEVRKKLGVSIGYLTSISRRKGIAPQRRMTLDTHAEKLHYSIDEVEAMKSYLDSIPEPRPEDVPVGRLGEELDVSRNWIYRKLKQKGSLPVAMRHTDSGIQKEGIPHVTKEDAAWLRSEFHGIAFADPENEITLRQAKLRYGIDQQILRRLATSEELEQGVKRRKPRGDGSSNKELTFYPRELVDKWVSRYNERLDAPLAGPQDVPLGELYKELDYSWNGVLYALRQGGRDVVKLRPSDGDTPVYHVTAEDAAWLRGEVAGTPMAEPDAVPLSTLGEEFGLDYGRVRKMMQRADRQPVFRRQQGEGRRGKTQKILHATAEDAAWFRTEMRKIPISGPGDVSIGAVCEELGVEPEDSKYVYRLLEKGGRYPVTMRSNNADDVAKGKHAIGAHVTSEDLGWLRRELASVPIASSEDATLGELSSELNKHKDAIRRMLEKAGRAPVSMRRGLGAVVPHVSKEDADWLRHEFRG